jgi:hypothetical protein
VFFLLFEVHPKPENPVYGEVDGAFAAAFVNDSSLGQAEIAARKFIDEAGWDIEGLDDSHRVALESLTRDHPGYAKVQQAMVDGIVVTFHEWPVGADDADDGFDPRAV